MDVVIRPDSTLPSQFTEPKTVSLLSPEQLMAYEQDIQFCEDQLKNEQVQNKGDVRTRLRNLKTAYERQAPQGVQINRDRLDQLEKRLRESVQEGMLTHEEMRKNPSGSVDKHMRWERAKKPNILLWKKVRRVQAALEGGNPATWDRESSNIEQLRPGGAVGRGYRGDAQIGGHMAYGDVPSERWPFDPPQNTALEQVKRAKKPSPPASEEVRQRRRENLALAREKLAAKKAAQRQADLEAQQLINPSDPHEPSTDVAESNVGDVISTPLE